MPYGSGTTPQKSDTRRMLLAKRLAGIQAIVPVPLAVNNEKRNDTLYRLQTRIDNALTGTATK